MEKNFDVLLSLKCCQVLQGVKASVFKLIFFVAVAVVVVKVACQGTSYNLQSRISLTEVEMC